MSESEDGDEEPSSANFDHLSQLDTSSQGSMLIEGSMLSTKQLD